MDEIAQGIPSTAMDGGASVANLVRVASQSLLGLPGLGAGG